MVVAIGAVILASCGGSGADPILIPIDAQTEDAEPSLKEALAATVTSSAYALPAGRYALLNAPSGKCIDTAGTANFQQIACNQNLTQLFDVSEASAGVFKLLNAGNGKVVDVAGASNADGALVQPWDDIGSIAQRFRIEHLGGDRFAFVNAGSGKCIAVTSGASLQQSTCSTTAGAQQFRLVPVNGTVRGAAAVGVYGVSSVFSGLCLDIEGQSAGDGAKVAELACGSGASQRFELRPDTAGSYRLVNVNSGKSLDVDGVSNASGALIQQWASGNGDNQRFLISAAADAFVLKAKHSGKCVDVKDWNAQPGGRIQQWDCSGASNQQWKLVPAAGAVVEPAWSCPAGPFGKPIPSSVSVTRLPNALPNDNYQTQYGNVEGAVWLGGSLYVSEFGQGNNPPPTRILKITGNAAGVVVAPSAGTNGLAADKAGNLYGASHKVGGIVRIGLPGSAETVIVSSYAGKRFNSPNDLTFRSDGTLYFTDPNWQAASPNPQSRTRVYRVAPGSGTATVVDENRSQPNGMTLSPDEKTLYLSAQDGLFKYTVAADGSVGAAARFASQVSSGDGMVVDCAGNLYVTDADVIVLNPQGAEVGRIHMPNGAGTVTNLAFGGADRKTLFITAMGSGNARGVYKVDLAVPGYPY